jgi:hypothetical protein
MGRARNLARLLVDPTGDVDASALGNVPPSDDASALTTGTLAVARLPNEGQSLGMRNRIINGDMRIDQRNAGASITVNAGNTVFSVDRFASTNNSSTAAYTLQRVTDAPAGFINSVKMTVTATDSLSSATQYCRIREGVEANNVDDFGWGGANAKTITVSFWVKSSVTGTFSMSILNSAYNYSYPVSYTINAADTWEQKSITIPGPTAGTWQTGTNAGLYLEWAWGANANILGPSGSWSANRYEGVTGQVNLMATNGATWFLTGVQLEVGSVATPFERRPYGAELALCQRYYYSIGGETANQWAGAAQCWSTTTFNGVMVAFPTTMRASPTFSYSALGDWKTQNSNGNGVNLTALTQGATEVSAKSGNLRGEVASGLSAGNATVLYANSTNARLIWSSEL